MKKIRIVIAFALLSLCTIGISHAIVFPQETRCILIDFHQFEKRANLYFRAGLDLDTEKELHKLIHLAEKRVDAFWGNRISQAKYIYCENKEDYLKFGAPTISPAAAQMKMGSYVVISSDGIDLNIISHELSHTELYHRIGFFNRLLKIPAWFDEGLAMQVDFRSEYSVENLASKTNNLQDIMEIKQLVHAQDFLHAEAELVWLHYATSKYLLEKWYSSEKLMNFINNINRGMDFETAYSQ